MRTTKRWQKSVLDAAAPSARLLPWATRATRKAWRMRCRSRALKD